MLKKKNTLVIGIPFFIFFGPASGLHEYNLFFIITIIIIQFLNKFYDEIYFFKLLFLIFFLGSIAFPYFSRNILTISNHGNNLKTTQNFLDTYQNQIRTFPSFVKMTNPNIRLKNLTNPTNFENFDFSFDVYSVNDNKLNCPTLSKKNPNILIDDFKIFNSNSSYDVYICLVEKNL